MSKAKVLGLAAGALLLLGVHQIAGAARAAAEENPAGTSADQTDVAKAAYYERHATGRRSGNIYGSQGVIAHAPVARRGYYGAGVRPHHYAHRYYRSRGYYGATGYRPQYYAHRYYPSRPVAGDGYYGATGYYPQYYAHRYYPTRPVVSADSYGSAAYYPQYYSRRYYPARSVVAPGYSGAAGYAVAPGAPVATTDPLSSVFAPTNWSSSCVNGRVCTGGYYYRGGIPMCRAWAACNY